MNICNFLYKLSKLYAQMYKGAKRRVYYEFGNGLMKIMCFKYKTIQLKY